MNVDNTQNIMTHCCHGTLYQNCVFGCKLWEYTRTYRKHYITDEDYTSYEDGLYWNLWSLLTLAGVIVLLEKMAMTSITKARKLNMAKP